MPAQPAASNPPPGGIKDYLTANIVLLVCAVLCCGSLPMLATSVVGVVFSSQVRSCERMGQLDEAERKARIARNMAIASGVLLAVSIILYVLILLLYGTLFTLPFLQGDFDDWFSWLFL